MTMLLSLFSPSEKQKEGEKRERTVQKVTLWDSSLNTSHSGYDLRYIVNENDIGTSITKVVVLSHSLRW